MNKTCLTHSRTLAWPRYTFAELSLACLCFLLSAAFVLRRLSVRPPAWTPVTIERGSTCPPAWRLSADENATSQDTYQECLARHGRQLDGGCSLWCAADRTDLLRVRMGIDNRVRYYFWCWTEDIHFCRQRRVQDVDAVALVCRTCFRAAVVLIVPSVLDSAQDAHHLGSGLTVQRFKAERVSLRTTLCRHEQATCDHAAVFAPQVVGCCSTLVQRGGQAPGRRGARASDVAVDTTPGGGHALPA